VEGKILNMFVIEILQFIFASKRKLELVAIARKRFKVADKVNPSHPRFSSSLFRLTAVHQVEHGAKLEDLQAAGKDKKAFVAQVLHILRS
jgi:hypothetical protein